MGQINFLSVLLLHFLIDMGHIDGFVFISGGRRQKHKQIMPFAGVGFSRGFGGQIGEVHVVNNDIGVVLVSPLLGKGLVEPFVIGRNKVRPLHDFEGLLLSCGPFRKQESRSESGPYSPSACDLYEVPARYAFPLFFAHW